MWAYGCVPLGKHTIRLEEIDPINFRIQSREKGLLINVWDHLIHMENTDGGTIYTDEIELFAGYLTTPVAQWSLYFYKHRQKRWQKLLKELI
jgi:hypothetical protein